jgi:Kef-type K+ transport system membrane component KefB
MELIVLTIGLQLRVLPESVYTMLVIMALVTTSITAPLLRFWIAAGRHVSPLVDETADPSR